MRFLLTSKGGGAPPDETMMAEMARYIEEMTAAGVLLATGGLDPAYTRVTSRDGHVTVTDGPFTETKDTIVSFALVEASSKEEVLELSRRFWKIVGDGEGDIHRVYGPGDAAS